MSLLGRRVPRAMLLLQSPYYYSTARIRKAPTPTHTQADTIIKKEETKKKNEQVPSSSISVRDMPRPSEIPWQARVSNCVNLIGHVLIPVQFVASSDGNYWAGTLLSQSHAGSPPFRIPIFFEGDQAHVAASHLKPNDLIHVGGHLSADPPFPIKEDQASVQVMVSSINFVEGSSKMKRTSIPHNPEEPSNKGTDKVLPVNMLSGTENPEEPSNKRPDKILPVNMLSGTDNGTHQDKSLKYANSSKGDPILNSWQDLLQNPKQWLDYRGKKSKGLIKPKHPDFKHADSGVALWLNTAPKWILSQLDGLEFKPTFPDGKVSRESKGIDVWNKLVENPTEWWDNRSEKRNPKSPDFKNKVTGEALWLSDSPSWILPKLPPLKDIARSATSAAATSFGKSES